MSLTDEILKVALRSRADMSEQAQDLARLSLLDWIACGRAAGDEPLVHKLRVLAQQEGGQPVASLFGGGAAPARMAALVNGATSHALDFDDTHFGHVGHLSVGLFPAALAVAEAQDAKADEVILAFLTGAEVAIRVGMVLGPAHYNLGFHQTATAGAFGAAVAAGRLLHLNADQMRVALGLCATRASGLKSQFGTMGKPYNAGIAAANGVEVAQLAQLGFSSADDGLMGVQGFVETHSPKPEPEAIAALPEGACLFEDNRYKLHACCHGLHAMIEALQDARRLRDLSLSNVTALIVRTNPRWLKVCDNKAPRSGLEVKFSYAWLAGMTLRQDPTGDNRLYTDALAADADLARFAERVQVVGDPSVGDMQTTCVLTLSSGDTVTTAHDLMTPVATDVLAGKLRAKAVAMLGPAGAEIWDCLPGLGTLSARDLGRLLRTE